MKGINPKVLPVRLDPTAYEKLRQQVLHRDGWRCQCCGTMSNLEVHHQQFRSHGGGDPEPNLITLCSACHSAIHCGHQRSFGIHSVW
jgi:5-methylcytosine-specific restriction protein A